MDEGDRERLLINRKLIMDVRFVDVKDSLLSDGVLTHRNIEEIESKITNEEKMSALLDLLPTRGPEAYEQFCKAVEECYSWVVDKLKSTVIQKIEDRKRVGQPYTELNHRVLSIVTKSPALKKFKAVVKWLGITDVDLAQIEHKDQHDIQEQFYQCLLKWQNKEGKNATVDKLITALREEDFNDVADKLDGYVE